jgi:hypothetical protein
MNCGTPSRRRTVTPSHRRTVAPSRQKEAFFNCSPHLSSRHDKLLVCSVLQKLLANVGRPSRKQPVLSINNLQRLQHLLL